jgi:RNA polymerase sigma-70 factor (ECF subfamily)
MALLVVLEHLTPEQRVAFVLHDVFGTPFDAVAAALGVSAEAARQHASRARRAVRERGPSRTTSPAEQRAVIDAFFAAAREGDLQGLLRLLDPDVVFLSDGGGIVQAARRPIVGAEKVARFVVGLVERAGPAEIVIEPAIVNGAPGALGWLRPPDGEPVLSGVVDLDIGPDGRVRQVAFVVNPEKLTRVVR